MTTDIQAPYRLTLADTPQQVMALQGYIQAAYSQEFTPAFPIFCPACSVSTGPTACWSAPAVSSWPAASASIWSSIWNNPSRPPSKPGSAPPPGVIASSKWATSPAASPATPA